MSTVKTSHGETVYSGWNDFVFQVAGVAGTKLEFLHGANDTIEVYGAGASLKLADMPGASIVDQGVGTQIAIDKNLGDVVYSTDPTMHLDLYGFGFKSLTDLQAHMSYANNALVISADSCTGAPTLTVYGSASNLATANFSVIRRVFFKP